MSLRVLYQYSTGATLSYAIKRMADGYNYDFSSSTFKNTTPTTIRASLPEDSLHPGIYAATLSPTPTTQFPDGDYAVYISDATGSAVGIAGTVMTNGDDGTVIASGGGSIDSRIEAFLIGRVTVDRATGRETFYAKDNPTAPVLRNDPDGSGGRIPVDLRGT